MVVPSPTIDPKETELPEKFGSREGGKLPLFPPVVAFALPPRHQNQYANYFLEKH
tara:strand:+ start:4931 stop:5095 length:165 start_codon:yes stop_codon:yes gene_type:complete